MVPKRIFVLTLIFAAIIFVIGIIFVNHKAFSPQNKKPFTYSADFSSVIGQLEFNPLEGGFWQVRFGSQNDPHGGLFVLGNDTRLTQFKNGDLVKITGKISENQISIYQAGTLYTIESVELLK